MKIRFIKPAAGLGFGYHAGEEADLVDAQAKELTEIGYAEPIEKVKEAVEEVGEVEVKKAVTKRK